MNPEQNPEGQTAKTHSHASIAKYETPRQSQSPMSSRQVDVTIGINLRRIRKQFNMSQTELGNLLGVSFQQIQKYERGINRLSISRALDICKILHISIGDFVVQLLQPRPKS